MTDKPKFYLKCCRCPEKLFQRDTNDFTKYETERCGNCGTKCEIVLDGNKPFTQQKALITID